MPKNVVCKKCNNFVNGWCERVIDSPDPDMVRDCRHFWEKTNADRIRAMSDEELAKILIFYGEYGVCHIPYLSCPGGKDFGEDQYEDALRYTIGWLQQPAEEGNDIRVYSGIDKRPK